MNKVLAGLRLIGLILIMALFILIVSVLTLFHGRHTKKSRQLNVPMIRLMLRLLGVRISMSGTLPDGPVLFVGNHISYLDPFVLVHHIEARPVAKIEAKSWPVLGSAVSIAGVLFVDRKSRDSLNNTREKIANAVKDGDSIIVYPEGTTGDGSKLLPFKRGIFELAAKHDINIVPVTIKYIQPQAPFVRRDTFLPHFIRWFREPSIPVSIHFGEKLKYNDGTILLEKTREIMQNKLEELNMLSA